MNIEKIGYVLSAVLTHERDNELSLKDHDLIRLACNRIVAKADVDDIKIILCANPEVAIGAAKEFEELSEIFDINPVPTDGGAERNDKANYENNNQ